jgi:hypothetical protein
LLAEANTVFRGGSDSTEPTQNPSVAQIVTNFVALCAARKFISIKDVFYGSCTVQSVKTSLIDTAMKALQKTEAFKH